MSPGGPTFNPGNYLEPVKNPYSSPYQGNYNQSTLRKNPYI
jgi:hypothetical protein